MLANEIQPEVTEYQAKNYGENNSNSNQNPIQNQNDRMVTIASSADERINNALVTNPIPETSPRDNKIGSSKSREKRSSHCPLLSNAASTIESKMQVHVFPMIIPFEIEISLYVGYYTTYVKHYYMQSDQLEIQKNKWSHFTVEAYNHNQYWSVRATGNGISLFSRTNFHRWEWTFNHLEVDIRSTYVSWYVGARNFNCDDLMRRASTLATTSTKTPSTSRTPTSSSTARNIITVESTTQAVAVTSEPLDKEGKMKL